LSPDAKKPKNEDESMAESEKPADEPMESWIYLH
jgi:hypothetical protein